jgi:hypothetical protein
LPSFGPLQLEAVGCLLHSQSVGVVLPPNGFL